MYDEGKGVARDPANAAAWYRKAAGQGNKDAQLRLGAIYAKGAQGVAPDYLQAHLLLAGVGIGPQRNPMPGESDAMAGRPTYWIVLPAHGRVRAATTTLIAWLKQQALLLNHLGRPYDTVLVSIFEGEGRTPAHLRINPTGKVPALRLDDGRTLAESNAILAYLADGTRYLPGEPFARAKVHQWLSFEQEQVEMTIGSLRYWTLTGKLPRRSQEMVEAKRAAALRTLGILDGEFSARPFIAGDSYTIADMSVFAYSSRAAEAGLSLERFQHFRAWTARVESQPGFLATAYPYSMDPHSSKDLP